MVQSLKGMKVAILATDGVEEVELTKPRDALKAAEAEITIVSLKAGAFQAIEKDVRAIASALADHVGCWEGRFVIHGSLRCCGSALWPRPFPFSTILPP